MPHNLLHPPAPGGRVRIAPVNSAMISSARSRDPRLARARPAATRNSSNQDNRVPAPMAIQLGVSSIAKSLPRIPKYSQSNNHKSSRDNDERDPRSRRNKDEASSKLNSKSPSSKDKKSPSSKSSSRSTDRKQTGSSDDSSPRKKSEDEKKSSKSSSHHRSSHSRSRSSKSPPKSSTIIESKDTDFRIPPVDINIQPDSTTSIMKLDLPRILLNGDEVKSSHETMTTDENGKHNKPILMVTISVLL